MLVRLTKHQLDDIASIDPDGAMSISTDALASTIRQAMALSNVAVAVSSADYFETHEGLAEPSTRSATGIWWQSNGDDTATIGSFSIDGSAMTVTQEGAGECPVVEDSATVERATKAIASQYPESSVTEIGLFQIPDSRPGVARVVVTRDPRLRRPQDLLNREEYSRFAEADMGLVIVQLVGGDKALVVKHGI